MNKIISVYILQIVTFPVSYFLTQEFLKFFVQIPWKIDWTLSVLYSCVIFAFLSLMQWGLIFYKKTRLGVISIPLIGLVFFNLGALDYYPNRTFLLLFSAVVCTGISYLYYANSEEVKKDEEILDDY